MMAKETELFLENKVAGVVVSLAARVEIAAPAALVDIAAPAAPAVSVESAALPSYIDRGRCFVAFECAHMRRIQVWARVG